VTTDAWLAIAHHLAVFGVFAVLVTEWAIVRPGLVADDIRRLARVDAAYGALAALVLTAGTLRVFAGARPQSFYLENPVFWAKIAGFATVGVLSIRPTFRYLGWRKDVDSDMTALPPAAEVARARRVIHVQLAVFASIPVLAALMARGIGL
jgi:putative membrane protein